MSAEPYDSRTDTMLHIGQVRRYVLQVIADLIDRAHHHDASKLEEPEKATFDEFTPLLKAAEYGSETYREYLDAMAVALEHHYAANDHHPEHFEDGVGDMDLIQMTEMLCDWKAASERHESGNLARSIDINMHRFGYGPEIRVLLMNTAARMGWL